MIGIGHGGEGVEFSDTSGIDGLGDVPDMPADVPADIPTDMTAHAIEGCDHMTTGDGSNPADFGTMQLFTLQGIMTFLCVFGWTGIICTSLGLHVAIAIIIALVLGFLAMLGVAKVLHRAFGCHRLTGSNPHGNAGADNRRACRCRGC